MGVLSALGVELPEIERLLAGATIEEEAEWPLADMTLYVSVYGYWGIFCKLRIDAGI